jgi:hypothetical protein
MHHLWAQAAPSTVGFVVLALLAGLGLVLVARVLGREDGGDAVDGVLGAIEAARGRLRAELERAEGPLRAALASMIAPPLASLEDRVATLAAAARAKPPAVVSGGRGRLEALLAREEDPRARVLIEAQLRDLDGSERSRLALERSARLALLELERMRTLLETLPLRVHEIALRKREDSASLEAIAQELELAVQTTGDVLEQVNR